MRAKFLRLCKILFLSLMASLGAGSACAQNANAWLRETNRFGQLFNEHRYEELLVQAPSFLDQARSSIGEATAPYVEVLSLVGKSAYETNRYEDADRALRQVVEIYERQQGPTARAVAPRLNDLVRLYTSMGRHREAQQYSERALQILEGSRKADDPEVATGLDNLAAVLQIRGRHMQTEPLRRRALAIREKRYGANHPVFALSLFGLGSLYQDWGRFAEAEPLLARALAIQERGRDPNNYRSATALSLAQVRIALGRSKDADTVLQRSEEVMSAEWGPNSKYLLDIFDARARFYSETERLDDAERLYQQSLKISERALGVGHPDVARTLYGLGNVLRRRGENRRAEELFRRALRSRETELGPLHVDVARTLCELAALRLAAGDTGEALELARRAVPGLTTMLMQATQVTADLKPQFLRPYLDTILHVLHAAMTERLGGDVVSEAMKVAQVATQTAAAAALGQMATRFGTGNDALARLVRDGQDVSSELAALDKRLIETLAKPATERLASREQALKVRQAQLTRGLEGINAQLTAQFPAFASIANPQPIAVREVQSVLRANEALVYVLDTDEWKPTAGSTFVWVIGKNDVRWLKAEVSTAELVRLVQILRCGVDRGAWVDQHCASVVKEPYPPADRDSGKPPPFDLTTAHELYRLLLSRSEDLIRGRQLLLVPTGALSTLPLNLLVTEPPTATTTLATAAWLGVRQALTVLPSVENLSALRKLARGSHARHTYLGFGNPLLEGNTSVPEEAQLAQEARDKRSCSARGKIGMARAVDRSPLKTYVQSGLADVALIKQQLPLPETADELCDVAASLGVAGSDVRLGARTTEGQIKALSTSGTLADYRILHFATHGVLPGELKGNAEPGLILTPPQTATEIDDGYLTASEIARMKLNADWVVLSACNTAGGAGANRTESLSGLARAFLYAGARSLLVSHWAVESDATTLLITQAFEHARRDPTMGRAEAVRQSMVMLISTNRPNASHPLTWAPFVLVGEGGG